MKTQKIIISITLSRDLIREFDKKRGSISRSFIIEQLIKRWLSDEVRIII